MELSLKPRIYHNPRCSKSRATLALLRDRGHEPEIIEYLQTPPSTDELKSLVAKLGVAPSALVRTNEDEFKQANVDLDVAADDQVLELLHSQPKLIQRPIVETATDARIGRPPERVLELFE
jgi:arsenate reductase